MIPEKALKCLNLALNESAPEGEWHSAAIHFCAILRRGGFTVSDLEAATEQRTPKPKAKARGGKSSAPPVMPMGKFKGQPFIDLPDWYLKWCLDQDFIDGPLRREIEKEFQTR